jgi:IS1 family transposase
VTRCITGWAVSYHRTEAVMQAVVDMGPAATQYHSDALAVYQSLVYAPGHHTPHLDKSETYSVEADNAELRHYLARLARRSRCFSRCIIALQRALRLFVWCWNQRQLKKHTYPRYAAHLIEFVPPLC